MREENKKRNASIFRDLIFYFIFLLSPYFSIGQLANTKTPTSTVREATELLKKAGYPEQSPYWPNIKPATFINNLKDNLENPLNLYEGSFTNFCGYAALSYLPLHYDPATYIKCMITLYNKGSVDYNGVSLKPSEKVRITAGTLQFKGRLDIRPADQMWFLTLADHFKGYINFFSKKYKAGAENTFWASVNYAKFNRMIKSLFKFNVNARGSDLIHPSIHKLTDYIQESLQTGTTFLYLNNAYLLKKNDNLKAGIPTHYIVLLSFLKNSNGTYSMTYWDYGFRSLRQLDPSFLKRILFGISHCTIQ